MSASITTHIFTPAGGATRVAGSELFFNANHGAMTLDVTDQQIVCRFVTRAGDLVDTYTLEKR